MAKVAVVTDSTAAIPTEVFAEYPLWEAPQVLIFGEESLEDRVDIQPSQFYERLETDPIHPTTSQVTPASFQKIFSKLLDDGYDILAVLVSPKLSGTIESAKQVKAMYPDAGIEIFNSESVAMGLGWQALMAARAAKDGATLAECKEVVEKARPLTGVVFAVDTLEYLHRGGRIGGGAKFLGTALNFKPILEIRDGAVESIERVRTRRKSLARVVRLIEERIDGRKPLHLATLHAKSEEDARWLLEVGCAHLHPEEKMYAEVSPAVGTHGGPGVVGLAFLAGM
ncbi:MAG: DegV family protein [Chloroflexota bacterium]|nr:MAG: DegV family protein [Chloroflexota bacterium]